MLDEIRIKELCEENGYGCRCFHGTTLITTGIDAWKLEVMETSKGEELIRVKHINKNRNKKGKFAFHRQRISYDVDWIFENIIIPHGRGGRVFQKAFRVKELLEA